MTVMRTRPDEILCRFVDEGARLHLRHGPIEVWIEADASPSVRDAAYEHASRYFADILYGLTGELDLLRTPMAADAPCRMQGAIGKKMFAACTPYAQENFITPMAAVAGAVADALLEALKPETCKRVWVNNGGDIALYLARGAHTRIGICEDIMTHRVRHAITIQAGDNIGGIATSGRQGRSHSLGIADAVTVLARTAAEADAAATLIANYVNLPANDSRITRTPAVTLAPDSDLGGRLVTVDVAALDAHSIDTALQAGADFADSLCERTPVKAAFLALQGRMRVVGMSEKIEGGGDG